MKFNTQKTEIMPKIDAGVSVGLRGYLDSLSRQLQKNYRNTRNDLDKISGSFGLMPRLNGLTLSNGTDADHDIDIAAGSCMDSTSTELITLPAVMTKRLDAAWAAGIGGGGLFSGSIANNTWYYPFLIKDRSGNVDAGFDTSITAANIPPGYSFFRRTGAVITNSSANIVQFYQEGNTFNFKTPSVLIDAGNFGTSAVLAAVTCPPNMVAIVHCSLSNTNGTTALMLITSPYETDQEPTTALNHMRAVEYGRHAAVRLNIKVNSSSQIRYRSTYTAASNFAFRVISEGFVDNGV